jgi:hypothetical protein
MLSGGGCMGLWSDIRISVRTLTKNRVFTIAAILTVAIGIGSTTAIATIVDSILLRPVPYPDSDRMVQVISYRQEGATVRSASMARPFIVGLTERSRSFSDVGVFDSFSNITRRRLTMTIPGQLGTAELYGTRISPVLFSMLGARPQLGRLFVPGDERPERNGLIILSDRSWRAQYAGDPRVLGSSLTIDGRLYTLVGIMSRGFAFPDAQSTREIGIRMAIGAAPSRVLAAVLQQSLTLTGIGAAIGLLGAAAVTKYLESMLFELTPLDPSTFVAVAVLFLLVALLASYLPAARASRVDPLVALRHD